MLFVILIVLVLVVVVLLCVLLLIVHKDGVVFQEDVLDQQDIARMIINVHQDNIALTTSVFQYQWEIAKTIINVPQLKYVEITTV